MYLKSIGKPVYNKKTLSSFAFQCNNDLKSQIFWQMNEGLLF